MILSLQTFIKRLAALMTSMIASPKEPEYLATPHQLVQQNSIPWIVASGTALEYFGFDSKEGSPARQKEIKSNMINESKQTLF